jgi:hypothetical protein
MNNQYYEHYEEDKIRELLMYRKIVKVENNTLFLDNGTELEILANVGCGGCFAGWYEVTELNGCDNAITNVEFVCEDINDPKSDDDTSYKIFVYAEDKRIKILQVDGSDGNGYYGTGYSINVKVK